MSAFKYLILKCKNSIIFTIILSMKNIVTHIYILDERRILHIFSK